MWTEAGSRSGGRDSVAQPVPLDAKNIRGTGAWMAPEIVTREVEVTTKADVYSFGVVLWEIVSPDQDLLGAWETAAFGRDQWLRNAGIVPDWAARGLRPAIPAAVRDQEKDWADVIEKCWQTDPDKRPSFPKLLRMEAFVDSGAGETSETLPRPAAAVLELAPEPAPEPEPRVVVVGPVENAYGSETAVTQWLKEQGLGRIAGLASAHEDYCDMESYEDLVQGPEAAVGLFCRLMGLSDAEQVAFVAALRGLGGPVHLFVSRPASPGATGASGGAGTSVSRPASPTPTLTNGDSE